MNTPEVGIAVCGSWSSNTGLITGLAASKVIKKQEYRAGILSLPALVNRVTGQVEITKKIPHIIVVDGCHNECAKKIFTELEIRFDTYVHIKKEA